MKYTVKTAYVDRYTLQEHKEGEVLELDKTRAEELKEYIEKQATSGKKKAE